jgi:glycyl-tRNA synthetase alpha chain
MEVLQFTYMQQLGGIELKSIPAEITYGLERLAMYIQNVDNFWDIKWNKDFSYKDVFFRSEVEYSRYNFELADIDSLYKLFSIHITEAKKLVELNNLMPGYDQCLKASHIFNLLEARGAFSVSERATYMGEIRAVVRQCCERWYNLEQAL